MITEFLQQPILCAVSGGVDSMYLLCRLAEEGYRVMAAHFNHGLRGPEADRDEAFVRDFCRERDIPFYAGRGDVEALAAREGLGTEETARRLRYEFLERTARDTGAASIATAHTADDNAETLLFHLARGTGLKGLGGIPPQRGQIVRPLLDETREQAEQWLAQRGIPHVEDSSNASDDYARNRIRHAVMPVMKQINTAAVRNMTRTAAQLRCDEAFLESLAREHVEKHGADAGALAALPEALAGRAVRLLAGTELSARQVQTVLQLARQGGAADVTGVHVQRLEGKLVFGPALPPELPEREVTEGELYLPEAGLLLRCSLCGAKEPVHDEFTIFFFPRNRICGRIKVGARRPGDRMHPRNRGCGKSLKQLFLEEKIPARQRGAWPVLRDEAGVMAVYGLAVDERFDGADDAYIKTEFIPCNREEES